MSEFRRKLLISYESKEPVDPTLIFFAPLSYGDLTDHISGNMLNNYSSFVSWNSSQQMYHVDKPTTRENCPYWNVDFTGVLPKTPNQTYTFIVDGKSVKSSSYNYPEFFSLGYFYNGNWVPCIAMDGWRESDKTSFKRRVTVFDGNAALRYADGMLTERAEQGSTSGWRVSRWQTQSFQKVCLNPFRNKDEAGLDIYVKNLRIYNRALSIEEAMSLPM